MCEGPGGAGAVGGVDQRGGAPGTRETDLLRPLHLVQRVHAVLLAGGSAFGLAAADGVMRYLRERDVGFDAGVARVPIVPAAILFDLAVGSADAYPNADMGYAACRAASDAPVAEGRVGVGTGCTAGKALGSRNASPAGVGSAAMALDTGSGTPLQVAALIGVNPYGDVVAEDGRILAGTLGPDGRFADTLAVLGRSGRMEFADAGATVIGVVATNARLDKEGANKIAQMAHDGIARAIRPAHTMYDGDTIFAIATCQVDADVNLAGALAAEVVAQAIRRGARSVSVTDEWPVGPAVPG